MGPEYVYSKCNNRNYISRRNNSGMDDPTAYEAIRNADQSKYDAERFFKVLNTIHNICELSDFHIEEHIILKDKRTGKVWR